VTFRVTWGSLHGADPRRLLAVACRRGDIRGSDVGAIRVEGAYSLLDVTRDVADGFETQAARPDPRDPRVRITRADKALPEDERTDVPSVPPSEQSQGRPQSDMPPRHAGSPRQGGPPRHAGQGGSPRYAGPAGRSSGPPRHADSSARPPSGNGASRPEKAERPEGAAPPPAKFETPKRRRVVGAEPPVRKRSKG